MVVTACLGAKRAKGRRLAREASSRIIATGATSDRGRPEDDITADVNVPIAAGVDTDSER